MSRAGAILDDLALSGINISRQKLVIVCATCAGTILSVLWIYDGT